MHMYGSVASQLTPHRAYAFVDGAHFREYAQSLGLRWQDVRVSRLASDCIGWAGRAWIDVPISVARTHIYDATDESVEGDVETWLSRHERERDTHVRRGHLRASKRKPREQKAVDVLLAVDALSGAYEGRFGVALFVTGDADFAPVIEAVGLRGVLTMVVGQRNAMATGLAEVADRIGYLPDDLKHYKPSDYWLP